jgi:hypothetical protein
VFTDGDVVWRRDPLPFIRSRLEEDNVDAVFMCDSETAAMEQRINSGFYLMRSTPKTANLFTEARIASIYTLQSKEQVSDGDVSRLQEQRAGE